MILKNIDFNDKNTLELLYNFCIIAGSSCPNEYGLSDLQLSTICCDCDNCFRCWEAVLLNKLKELNK